MSILLNNEIYQMEIGDYVWCKYTASSGKIGVFSDFATKTDAEVANQLIPVASSATPNGYFKFIMVHNWNGDNILVADRNIQHSISWDTLNTAGIASGNGLPYDSLIRRATIRLFSGGVTSADKDNEWDKYIVNTNLNGAITVGDNIIWNAVTWSWTSTTSTASTHRAIRGGGSVGEWNGGNPGSSYIGSNVGFRPAIVISSLLAKSFILDNGEYKRFNVGRPEKFVYATETAIPKMTSNTTPSGRAFAKTIWDSKFDAYGAFNQIDDGEGYASQNGSGGVGYLGYEFASPIAIGKYTLRSANGTSTLACLPKDWSFEGSDDLVSWVVLDVQKNQSWTTAITDKVFNISNYKKFKAYRLNYTANNGSGYTNLNELKMHETISHFPAISSSWKTISTTLPSVDTFVSDGMNDLSVFDREPTEINVPMDDNGATGEVFGSGILFKEKIDLKKYIAITSIKVK